MPCFYRIGDWWVALLCNCNRKERENRPAHCKFTACGTTVICGDRARSWVYDSSAWLMESAPLLFSAAMAATSGTPGPSPPPSLPHNTYKTRKLDHTLVFTLLQTRWSNLKITIVSEWKSTKRRGQLVFCLKRKTRDYITLLRQGWPWNLLSNFLCWYWPRGLRRVWSFTAPTFGSQIRISLEARMYIRVLVCCVIVLQQSSVTRRWPSKRPTKNIRIQVLEFRLN